MKNLPIAIILLIALIVFVINVVSTKRKRKKINDFLVKDANINILLTEFKKNNQNLINSLLNIEHEEYKEYVSINEIQDYYLNPYKVFLKKFEIIVSNKLLDDIKEKLNYYSLLKEYKDKLAKLNQDLKDYIETKGYSYDKLNFISEDNIDVVFNTYKMIPRNPNYQGCIIAAIEIVENKEWLTGLYEFVEKQLNKNKSMLDQRKLMTPQIRKSVLERDNYTCCHCGANIFDEPNLLLEVDHIIPVSKGGITEIDNLQTLCWKCNRSKSAKL